MERRIFEVRGQGRRDMSGYCCWAQEWRPLPCLRIELWVSSVVPSRLFKLQVTTQILSPFLQSFKGQKVLNDLSQLEFLMLYTKVWKTGLGRKCLYHVPINIVKHKIVLLDLLTYYSDSLDANIALACIGKDQLSLIRTLPFNMCVENQ